TCGLLLWRLGYFGRHPSATVISLKPLAALRQQFQPTADRFLTPSVRSCIQDEVNLYTRTAMPNYSQKAYDHIRSKLAQGLLGGAGDRPEPILARELGISRTPIREAIRQLASEGLLEQRAKQGTFIRRPDRRDLDEIYQVRIL